MTNPFDIKNILKKDVKNLCLSIGGLYTFFGIFALLMFKFQALMTSNLEPKPDEGFMGMMNTMHELWNIYMPIMIFIGVCYLIFGFKFDKIKTKKYQINLVLRIVSFLWVIAYTLSALKFVEMFSGNLPDNFGILKYMPYIFAGFGFIVMIFLFTFPQYIIGKRIKNQEDLDDPL